MSRPVTSESLRLIFGLKVKSFRQKRGLSLVQLARASGLATSYLSEIEQGRKYPKPEKMLNLAAGLGVPFDELVSLQVDERLDPLTALMESDLVQEFPFDLFGLAPRDILHLFRDTPEKATAFLQTFVEIGRTYDMGVENFLLAALRTYQKQHANHFPDLEEAATAFRAAHPDLGEHPGPEALADLLRRRYGYRLDDATLARDPRLAGFRSVYRDGPVPTLFINPRLLPSQRAFLLGRELGFRELGLHEVRPATSSWLRVESFDHLVHNFRASYFAGALLLPREEMEPALGAFLQRCRWDADALGGLLSAHRATPEMFLYRMSQLLPGCFGLDRLFYLRFTRDGESGEVSLTKELNLTDELVPYGLGLREHYCRRWLPLQQLAEEASAAAPLLVGIQKARFLESGSDFLLISMARPLSLSDSRHSAMTIGLMLDDRQRDRIGFADDPAIPAADVNETCERCSLPSDRCAERAAAPSVHRQQARQRAREEALARLLDGSEPQASA